jgi:uncharacterized membrane protein YphA (DoxX/SURF4 family)
LLAASILKFWFEAQYPQMSHRPWMDNRAVAYSTVAFEAILGLLLLTGLWPRPTWYATVTTFGLFAIITAAETLQGKTSCGCFGTLQVRPVYTLFLDLTAVAMLLATGPPKVERQKSEGSLRLGGSGSERMQNGEAGRGRLIIAAVVAVAWVASVSAMWSTRPVIAVATTTIQGEIFSEPGQTFGKPGELVLLEPEKWTGQHFSLADHIDVGPQLMIGQWIVLLVHHDCDHCAAAVPRYVAAFGATAAFPASNPRPPTHESTTARLAVIEMPPFADPTDPPPWQLPPSVRAGRLDQSRDWFATTPLALRIKDGIVLSSKNPPPPKPPSRNAQGPMANKTPSGQ